MDAVSTNPVELYVERITETYTGMELLGVGGFCDATDTNLRLEVLYDEEVVVQIQPEKPTPGRRRHFSTQLPIEFDKRQVQIRLTSLEQSSILFDQPIATIGTRSQSAEAPKSGPARLIAVLKRGVHSLISGEIFSLWRWRARISRMGEIFLRLRQKLRGKLLRRKRPNRSQHDAYIENTQLTNSIRADLKQLCQQFRYQPKISILLPVFNSSPRWLQAAVDSVFNQIYPNWELCISDDASTVREHEPLLKKWESNPRVKVIRRTSNGHISANSNSAADLATGEFVALLDHDDALSPHALLSIVQLLQTHPEVDLIYSDEDKVTEDGHRYDPQFKPDWSPDLLFSYNYINHFTCIRRRIFEQVGRFRVGMEGSQDHDLLLRVTEQTDRIYHIPDILYHWRAVQESTAGSAGVKPYVHTSGLRAVQDAISRRNGNVQLYVPEFAQRLGLPILAWDGNDEGPSVAVIVYGPATVVTHTSTALQQLTDYRHLTIVPLEGEPISADDLNAKAVTRHEDYLLFFQAELFPTDSRWLSRLMAHAQAHGVGALGALIRNPKGEVLSAGTILGMHDGKAPESACCGLPAGQISYYFYAEVTRTVSAVGKGCLLTPRVIFQELGGFQSRDFPNSLFDVDYCLRLQKQGLRTVHVGGAELQGNAAHVRKDDPEERQRLQKIHRIPRDPFDSPSLSKRSSFELSGDNLASSPVSSAPLKTWVAAHNLNSPEGAPRYLSEIVIGLSQRKCLFPRVFSPMGGAGEAVYTAEKIPVSIAREPWSVRFVDGQWSPREYEHAQNCLIQELQSHRPDLVLANTLLTFPVIEAATRLGIPSAWIIHESYSPDVLARLFTPYARNRVENAFRYASRVIPASHDTARLFQHWNVRGNFSVLHNGLPRAPIDEFLQSTPRVQSNRKRILAMGTVCERKGQHTLVEAAAILAQSRSDFVITIVGVRDLIPYSGYVRQLVKRHRLEGHVELISETNNPFAYYRTSDIFVCTSHMETFSRAILEAEAFGLPVVSTACCGISEQVVWDQNALQFDFYDARGLSRCLDQLLTDDNLRLAMGQRSRAMFENHWSYEQMLDRYEYVLRSACSGLLPVAASEQVKMPKKHNLLRLAG